MPDEGKTRRYLVLAIEDVTRAELTDLASTLESAIPGNVKMLEGVLVEETVLIIAPLDLG